MIRNATLEDIETIVEITKACAKFLIASGIFQWNETYPNKTAFENDIKRGELYVFENSSRMIGCIVVSTLMDLEYNPVKWLTPNNNNIYIHRLAVHPNFQGHGYARILMDFAEELAIKNNYSSIRLDTFSKNKRNQKFYELRGYKKLGEIFFPNQSEFPFYCYELIL
jgi:ribosomal protein S18 acetylase RimI-like enzyme